MISRIKLLQSIGPFDSVSTGGTTRLGRLTLIYAENGRGKTTLAAILRSVASGDRVPIVERKRLAAERPLHVVLEDSGGPPVAVFENNCWSPTLPNLIVFDDEFIAQNVHSGLVVEPHQRRGLHDLILGAKAVSLKKELDGLVQTIETHNRDLREKADAIPSVDRDAYSVDDFCDLPKSQHIDKSIQEAERYLAAANDQDAVRTHPPFDMLTLPGFDLDSAEQLLLRDLPALEAATLDQVQKHLDGLGAGGEVWVSEGMTRIPQAEGSTTSRVCPFCAQDLGGSILADHYRTYFGDAYTSLKESVSLALDELRHEHGGNAPVQFERAVRVTGERRQFWSRFCQVGDVTLDTGKIVQDWEAAREAVVAHLSAKQAAPLEPISLSAATRALVATFDEHRDTITNTNAQLAIANDAIETSKELSETASTDSLTKSLAELRAIKARYQPETAALCTDYVVERSAKKATEQKRDATRSALNKHRLRVFPEYQTAVNQYLNQFNAGFRLDHVTPANTRTGSTCTYSVLINDTHVPIGKSSSPVEEPSFRNTLSAGDRNTLALAFFFASLDQDPSLGDKIIVIDDPISSFDEHRTVTTVHAIRNLVSRTDQLIVLSHRKPFLCQIWEHANDKSRVALEIARDHDGSSLREWNVNEDSRTEHDLRNEQFERYIDSGCGDRRQLAKSIRPHLESFFRVAYPTYYLPGTLIGQFIGRCREMASHGKPILDAEKLASLAALAEYAKTFHHDANPRWEYVETNDQELLGFVKATLELTRL